MHVAQHAQDAGVEHIQVYTPQTVSFEVRMRKGVATSRKRVFVVELQRHVLTQLLSGEHRKVVPLRDYASMNRKGCELECILDDGRGHRRRKVVVFQTPAEAETFQALVTLDNSGRSHTGT